jgi:hypothetical protein
MSAVKPDANGIRPFANSIRIEAVPPSLNKYLRMHWAVKKKLRYTLGNLIVIGLGGAEVDKNPPKMRVQISVHSKGARARMIDRDNLYGSCKPLIDAMRDVGLIRNDSPKWLDLGVCENRDDGPFTVIEFEEAK